MAEWLAVVCGAGASKDCVAEGNISEFNPNFRPPLTVEIFDFRPEFNGILNKYPKANAVSENIRTRLRDKENLEDILKELMSAANLQVKKQVWSIAFFLQELLWAVSEKFVISGGTKYDTLIGRLLTSRFDQVLFFTLNYDLLLDRAIAKYDDVSFDSMDAYCPASKKWALIKPHGSVNWGRRLLNGRSDTQDADLVLSSLDNEPDLAPDVEVLRGQLVNLENGARISVGKMLFPAVALPARGVKDFVCPKQHMERAEQFLTQCKNFLFIGFSGLDSHVLGLFGNTPSVDRIWIVNGTKEGGTELYERLVGVNPTFGRKNFAGSDSPVFEGGFRSFMDNRSVLDRFISR